jgi:A/G-specific adenine glycosylase
VAFRKNQFHATLTNWYHKNGRVLPWRQTRDPYAILVSEIMLQQTQVATVIPYYNEWLRRFPDFAALARASESDILHAWQGLGYYARARNLQATAKTVQDLHGGRFPRDLAAMRALPGIGRYTANAIATFAFGRPVPIVETNTARILARLFNFRSPIDRTAGRKALWKRASILVPRYSARIYNSALIDLGALVCVPHQPKCGICPVKKFCRAKNPEALPIKKMRSPTFRLTENHAFIVRQKTLLLQRANHRWCGMWILPPLPASLINRRPVYRSTFPFTNHCVAMNVYARRRWKIDKDSQRWIRVDLLESIPIPSPHRRAVRHLLSEVSGESSRRRRSSGP